MYGHIAEGITVQNKCGWYGYGEKCTKFFMNLERKCGVQNHICKLIFDGREIVNPKEISQKMDICYDNLFRKQSSKSGTETKQCLSNVTNLILFNDQVNL